MYNFVKRTWAEINLNNIEHNFLEIKSHLNKNTKLCCVIKADGYGHGAVNMALEYVKLGADWFAVSNIEEALELRNANINTPILILGYTPVEYVNVLCDYNLSQTVFSVEYAKLLSDKAVILGVNINIHLKIDTGMSRLGLMCNFSSDNKEVISEALCISKLPNLNPEGIYTHFAVSDEHLEGSQFTNMQYESFMSVVEKLSSHGVNFKIRHCSNSGAIIDYPKMQLDMVRAGIILYGLSPSQKLKDKFNLIPAMELKSVISHIKTIEKDTAISYGRTFVSDKKMTIATIPIGYADGYIRTIANNGYIGINGQKAKILGRICMDQMIVDVSQCKDIKIGQSVIIFGNDKKNSPTIDEVAQFGNTINYEVVCLVGKRVARVYIKDNEIINTKTLTQQKS